MSDKIIVKTCLKYDKFFLGRPLSVVVPIVSKVLNAQRHWTSFVENI